MIVKCGKVYSQEKLDEICEILNEGHDVQILMECEIHDPKIDFESAHFASELYSIYGDRLSRVMDDTVYHSYKLRDID